MNGNRSHPAPFVGRERELAAAIARLDSAGQGEGGVICITGEPGIGKSRLLHELATHAEQDGWRLLSGRAYDVAGMPPYLPLIEALRPELCAAAPESLAAFATGAPALVELLPELAARLGPQQRAPALGPEAERFRIFEAVSTFLVELTRRPGTPGVLLLLDDLHWADVTSLLLLQHVARKVAEVNLLVAVAYRSTEIAEGHPIDGIMSDLGREYLCEVLPLSPLTGRDTSTLIASATGSPAPEAFSRTLHRETAGNPFFIAAVLQHLLETGGGLEYPEDGRNTDVPHSVKQVIRQRLSRLASGTGTALEAAAVLGDSFDADLLATVVEMDGEPLGRALEAAERAGLIREDVNGFEFAHSLIRRTIYDDLTTTRRRQIHRAAALAMETAAQVSVAAGPAAIGNHWRSGGRPDLATDYLLRAGAAAIGMTAWLDAIRHWKAASDCMEQAGATLAKQANLLEGLGELSFLNSFEAHPSTDYYERAAQLYLKLGDELGAARASAAAGRSLLYPSTGFDFERALRYFRAAEPVLTRRPVSVELGELYAAVAHAETHVVGTAPEAMIASMRRAGEVARNLEDGFLRDFLDVQTDHLQGHFLSLQGRLAEGLALEERACSKAAQLKDKGGPVNQWQEHWRELLQGHGSGSRPVGGAGSIEFSRVASRVGLVNMTTNCCGWQSLELMDPLSARAKHEQIQDAQGRFLSPLLIYDLFLLGDLKRIHELMDTGGLSPVGEAIKRAPYLSAWGEGRMTDAETALAQSTALWHDAQSRQLIVFCNHYTTRLYRVMGRPAKARAAAEESLRIALASCAVKYEFAARCELAILLVDSGNIPDAEEHIRRCREILSDGEDWRGLGVRESLAESLLAAASGGHALADTLFARTAEASRALSLPWDEAETYESWARACSRFSRGRVRRAFVAERLSSARAVYERIGAGQPWLDRLGALERSLIGVPHANSGDDFPDGLTAREAEILGMVAGGLTSRDVGERLFLSVRTVERHLANVYAKTGTHNRAQLTAYALSQGLA